ncbi:MAG: cytochrome c biogenesis protein DipZ [Solirubrobacteraceae bacterium]|nr:cytochrome c biogenesis protein DipZ [Solirubrobacteraceae bacterium]
MLLLVLFALLAGAATAVSPCVLPVLPVALAGGATGGRRRPLGIVIGLTLSFTFAAVALVYVIDALGLPDDLVRTLAVVTLIGFGIVLAVPSLAARVEAPLSRLGGRIPTGATRGDGFGSGLVLGAGLGLVYAPCAGPILAGVVTVTASQPLTAQRVLVALAYAVGSGLVLYALMLGGRRLTRPLARRAGAFQVATGAVMVLVGVAMLGDLDLRFQSALADHLPASIVTPTASLERQADDDIARLRTSKPHSGFTAAAKDKTADLPVLGTAPGFDGGTVWHNSAPLTMADLRGRVVLVDVWTYSCINCLRTLPYLRAWSDRYERAGLTIVGVHAPEFAFEKSTENVAAAIKREHITWPVVQDNDFEIWNAWQNQYWPTEYLVDARGRVRAVEIGEGNYEERERSIRALLAEANDRVPGKELTKTRAEQPGGHLITPESYLGYARATSFDGELVEGDHTYEPLPGPTLPTNHLRYGGPWNVTKEEAIAGQGAALQLGYHAQRVFLVLSSPGKPRRVRLELDGKPLPNRLAGTDVRDGYVTVREDRLYRLVDLPQTGDGTLTLHPEPGVRAYAFTFG